MTTFEAKTAAEFRGEVPEQAALRHAGNAGRASDAHASKPVHACDRNSVIEDYGSSLRALIHS